MKHILIIGFLLYTFSVYPQNNQPKVELINKTDTLSLWNYDILTLTKDEKIKEINPVGKIVFFRNVAIKDSLNKNGSGLKPAVVFYVYPVAMLVKVKALSNKVSLTSSCQPPDRGGKLYVLKNFILLNSTSCTLCSTSAEKNIDLCTANINKIISFVADKEYKSLEQLYKDLTIKKAKYY